MNVRLEMQQKLDVGLIRLVLTRSGRLFVSVSTATSTTARLIHVYRF